MKKRVFLAICILMTSFKIYGYDEINDVQSYLIKNKIKEHYRENIRYNKFGYSGYSGSSQKIEFDFGKTKSKGDNFNYNIENKGVISSTLSNFVENPNDYLGVTLGYKRLKSTENKERFRTQGINYLYGKNINNWYGIGTLGYVETKNKLENSVNYKNQKFSGSAQLGYYGYNKNLKFDMIPYVEIEYSYNNNDYYYNGIKKYEFSQLNTFIGIEISKQIKKFFITLGNEWWHNNFPKKDKKIDNYPIENDSWISKIKVDYFWEEDFIISLEYKKIYNKNYDFDMGTLELTHLF